jgi:hypothetical protein
VAEKEVPTLDTDLQEANAQLRAQIFDLDEARARTGADLNALVEQLSTVGVSAEASKTELHLSIRCRDLVMVHPSGQNLPMAQVQLVNEAGEEGEVAQTEFKINTPDPIWDTIVQLRVEADNESSIIKVRIMDIRQRSQRLVGVATVSVRDVLGNAETVLKLHHPQDSSLENLLAAQGSVVVLRVVSAESRAGTSMERLNSLCDALVHQLDQKLVDRQEQQHLAQELEASRGQEAVLRRELEGLRQDLLSSKKPTLPRQNCPACGGDHSECTFELEPGPTDHDDFLHTCQQSISDHASGYAAERRAVSAELDKLDQLSLLARRLAMAEEATAS